MAEWARPGVLEVVRSCKSQILRYPVEDAPNSGRNKRRKQSLRADLPAIPPPDESKAHRAPKLPAARAFRMGAPVVSRKDHVPSDHNKILQSLTSMRCESVSV